MTSRPLGAIMALWALAFVGVSDAAEPQYPARPIRLIVPFAPGGPTDVIARVLAAKLSENLGQQVVVDNRGGAGGNIGMGIAANAPPDGYTLILVSSSFVVNPGLYERIPYDPHKSFAPVTNVAASPNVFTAHPSHPVKTMTDVVKLVQTSPRKYSFATPGIGTTPDLAIALLKVNFKLDITSVPFGGAGPAVAALIGNQVPFGCTALPPTTPHIQAGRLRPLAVTGTRRSPALPDVPTTAEAGLKGLESDTLQGMLLPAGTPKAIVSRLHAEVVKIVALPDVSARVTGLGFDIIASTPDQFAAQIRNEVEKWTKVVKNAGIKVQ